MHTQSNPRPAVKIWPFVFQRLEHLLLFGSVQPQRIRHAGQPVIWKFGRLKKAGTIHSLHRQAFRLENVRFTA